MGDDRDRVRVCSKITAQSWVRGQPAKQVKLGNRKRTNKIGPTTKTKIATNTTSRIMTYITLSTPKVNHQRCGEDRRQEFAELNRRICTSTNQTSVNVDPRSDNLTLNHKKSKNVWRARLEESNANAPGINPRVRRWGIRRLPLCRSIRVSLDRNALRPSAMSCGTRTVAWMSFGVIGHVAIAVPNVREAN